jgi:hypothetical protein
VSEVQEFFPAARNVRGLKCVSRNIGSENEKDAIESRWENKKVCPSKGDGIEGIMAIVEMKSELLYMTNERTPKTTATPDTTMSACQLRVAGLST